MGFSCRKRIHSKGRDISPRCLRRVLRRKRGPKFSFTNSPGGLFGVLATTNLSLPLINWTALGGVTEVAPGQFQFTDPQATNGGQRYYCLYTP